MGQGGAGGVPRARVLEDAAVPGAALREFDRQVARVYAPVLVAHDFGADGRVFRSPRVGPEHAGVVLVVDLQVGVRALAGRFTVNLGVFDPVLWPSGTPAPREHDCHPDLRQRLGLLLPPARRGLLGRLLGRAGPRDVWWPQSEDAAAMARTLEEVAALTVAHGLPWLEAHATPAARAEAARALAERKARLRPPSAP